MDCGLTGLTFKRPSLVKPQFAEECDLKGIVQRFLKTGQLPDFSERSEFEGDATSLPEDFQQLMDHNVQVRQQFELLPLEERNKFNNDPETWAAEQIAKADKNAQTDHEPAAGSQPESAAGSQPESAAGSQPESQSNPKA